MFSTRIVTTKQRLDWYLCGWNCISSACVVSAIDLSEADHNRDKTNPKSITTKWLTLSAFNPFVMMSMQMRYRKTMNINGVVRPIYKPTVKYSIYMYASPSALSTARRRVVVLRLFGICLALASMWVIDGDGDGKWWWWVANITYRLMQIHLHCDVVTL